MGSDLTESTDSPGNVNEKQLFYLLPQWDVRHWIVSHVYWSVFNVYVSIVVEQYFSILSPVIVQDCTCSQYFHVCS